MADQTESKGITLTDGETKLCISILKNLESDTFNGDAVAQECGYKSAKVAKDRWSQVKSKKFGITAANTPSKKGAATPAKKRTKGGNDEEVATPTPSKKARTPKAKKEATPAVEEAAQEEKVEEDAEEAKVEENAGEKVKDEVKEEAGDAMEEDAEKEE